MGQKFSGGLYRLTLAIAVAVLLAACAEAPRQPGEVVDPEPAELSELPGGADALQFPPSEHDAQFAAARTALAEFSTLKAEAALAPLLDATLAAEDRQHLTFLQARIAYLAGDLAQANSTLEVLSTEVLHPALRADVLAFDHFKTDLAGEHLRSAQIALERARRYPDSDTEMRNALWISLLRMRSDQRRRALGQALDPELRAYLQLAMIADGKGRPLNPGELRAWVAANPTHPAASAMPGGLGELMTAPTAESIALILPLSGRLAAAGKAVRDGYLAAHYGDRNNRATPNALIVLDRTRYPDSMAAYEAAVAAGAKLVIGPLAKTAVADLALLPQYPVPVLALNRIDQPVAETPDGLLQLSLSSEDEADRIAELAFGEGVRRALLIRTDDDWGRSMEVALRRRFTPLGGSIVSTALFNDPETYSGAIEGSLGIPASQQRARDVRGIFGNLEFTARRRADIDAVFLLTRNSAQARALKPLLAFHYAGDLPVWGTSTVYSGVPDSRDRDLDGVRLVEMPWLLEDRSGLQASLTVGREGDSVYTRLNALGADAYLLQRQLAQLNAGPAAVIPGSTGLLQLVPGQQLQREAASAEFDGADISPR